MLTKQLIYTRACLRCLRSFFLFMVLVLMLNDVETLKSVVMIILTLFYQAYFKGVSQFDSYFFLIYEKHVKSI